MAQAAGIEHQRLVHLLGRGVQMGFALEEWERSGIWVLTRADSAYPQRFKAHLKDQAPAVIYGVGDRALLEQGGLAIVGSRSVGPAESAFTAQVAGRCAKDGIQVVSGGARGVG